VTVPSVFATQKRQRQSDEVAAGDGAVLGTFPVPAGSFGVAFDGTNMWVTSANASIVSKL